MQKEKAIIIGGGPCGMSCAIELQERGISSLIIEKGNVVNTIYNYPTHQTFFSSSDKLEIGRIPFITYNQKPVRNQALAYYRAVAERLSLRINTFETVTEILSDDGTFRIQTNKNNGEICEYEAENVIIATGYYDQPNYMNIPGEELPVVTHYFKEAHPYFNKNVTIIGGKNSAVDATLELHKSGANVTVLYRGDDYSKSIKPWILPEFDSLIRKDEVFMEFNAIPTNITYDKVEYTVNGKIKEVQSDFVFAMTGYKPDYEFLEKAGVQIDETGGWPVFDENTLETNVDGIYVAGVVAAGYNNNKIFIENGRHHGELIADTITSRPISKKR